MTKRSKIIIIVLSVILIFVIGGVFSLFSFLSALAPPKFTITKDYISTNRSFINGVSIEKIRVDSMGENGLPVKYTTFYTTSCNIHHPKNKPPDPPDKIEFNKQGQYSWDEDTISTQFIHSGLSRDLVGPKKDMWWLDKFGKSPVCPLKFEPGQWYFITIGDPQITGIFFYIDKSGKEHQFVLKSGVSPI
jgi:hypothetical protein